MRTEINLIYTAHLYFMLLPTKILLIYQTQGR